MTNHPSRRRRRRSVLPMVILATWIGPNLILAGSKAAECPPEDKLRKQVVFLTACKPKCEPNTSAEDKRYATGALVSKNGLVLSVYSLFRTLGVEPNTKIVDESKFEVIAALKTDANNAQGATTRAHVVGFKKRRGLVLLKIDPEFVIEQGLQAPGIGEAPKANGTILCSVGYKKDDTQDMAELGTGTLTNFKGHRFYMYQTALSFDDYGVGSPVYDLNGELIGIGSDFDSGTGRSQVIPIKYADVLLAHVLIDDLKDHLSEVNVISQALQKAVVRSPGVTKPKPDEIGQMLAEFFETARLIRSKINWTPPRATPTCRLGVSYDKVVDAPPYVASAKFRIEISYTDGTGIEGRKHSPVKETLPAPNLASSTLVGQPAILDSSSPTAASSPRTMSRPAPGGTFCLEHKLKIYDDSKNAFEWDSIDSVTVTMNATMRDAGGVESHHEQVWTVPYPPAQRP